jgi:THO complex subunit 1
VPAAETVMRAVENNELDLEMATPDQQSMLQEAKMSNIWRVLRVTSKSRLNLFDKIDDGKQLKSLFQPDTTEEREPGPEGQETKIAGSEADKNAVDMQVDMRPEEVMQIHSEATVP